MSKREWWIFWAGTSAMGALIGALLHSPFVWLWNMVLLGFDIYMIQRTEK